jgi:iron complex outermembrane receptor protein
MTEYRSMCTTWDITTTKLVGLLSRSAIATKEHAHNLAFDSQFKGHVRTGPCTIR